MKTNPLCLLFLIIGCASAPPRPARAPDRARPARRVALFVVDEEPAPAMDPILPRAPIAARELVSVPAVLAPRPTPATIEQPLHPMAGEIVERTDMVTTKVIGRTLCEDQREVVLLHRYQTPLLARVEFASSEMSLESRPLASGERWAICPPATTPGQYVRTVITYHLCRPDVADHCEPERLEGRMEVDILPVRLLSHEIVIAPEIGRSMP